MQLYLDTGDKAMTDGWLASCKLNVFTEISRAMEYELIVYARVLLSNGLHDDAGLLLDRLLAFTEKTGRLHSRLKY